MWIRLHTLSIFFRADITCPFVMRCKNLKLGESMENSEWKNSHLQAFWKEIAPCEHIVQVYETDKIFLETLEGFAGTGILNGENVVIVATDNNIRQLDERLSSHRFNLRELRETKRYTTFDAEEVLSRFMTGNWPDEEKFQSVITEIISLVKDTPERKVRAFSEMVTLLWQRGLQVATVYLEGLWEQLCDHQDFTLYCAYPKNYFKSTPRALESICRSHTKVIDGSWHPSTEIFYRTA
jgi:hypothetical protein